MGQMTCDNTVFLWKSGREFCGRACAAKASNPIKGALCVAGCDIVTWNGEEGEYCSRHCMEKHQIDTKRTKTSNFEMEHKDCSGHQSGSPFAHGTQGDSEQRQEVTHPVGTYESAYSGEGYNATCRMPSDSNCCFHIFMP